jgi:hypothetical protein
LKTGRIAVPVLIVLAAVLVGGVALAVAGGLPPRSEQQASPMVVSQQGTEEDPTATPVPTPKPTLPPFVKEEATPFVNIGSGTGIEPGPKLTAKPSQAVEDKNGGSDSTSQKGDAPSQADSRGSTTESNVASQGTGYTWHDGDREMRVVLQNDIPAEDTANGGNGAITTSSKGGDGTILPVFRSESGGGEMTLPGGVILLLDETWDQAAVDMFFSSNNIKADHLTEIEFLDNAYLVKTDAGFPSLEMANSLHGQDGVIASSPNWSRERVAK